MTSDPKTAERYAKCRTGNLACVLGKTRLLGFAASAALSVGLLISEQVSAHPKQTIGLPNSTEFMQVGSQQQAPAGDFKRTWMGGFVYYPDGPTVMAGKISDNQPALAALPANLPIVIYMHGCSGINQASTISAKHYADAGFAVVLPNSFARTYKPTSCDPNIPRGGMHRGVLEWRHKELAHAIQQIRSLPGGKDRPVVAHGFSEGAITVATFEGDAPFKARIIEGWGCHSLWPEYRGLKARSGEPTLALVADNDPWFRSRALSGDCGAFMDSKRHRSVVYSGQDVLTNEHFLFRDVRVQKLVDTFLSNALASGN